MTTISEARARASTRTLTPLPRLLVETYCYDTLQKPYNQSMELNHTFSHDMVTIIYNYGQLNRKEVPLALTSMWDFKSDHSNIITKEFQHILLLKPESSSH